MSSIELSKYQKDILNFVENRQDNLLVDAKAGSGKTSTLVLLADRIIKQNKKCLFLAFNKSIVQELQTRIISDNCQIKTLHSLGLSFLRSYLYKKHGQRYELEIDQKDIRIKDKVEDLFTELCLADFKMKNVEMNEQDKQDLLSDVLREIANMVNFTRLYNINYKDHNLVYNLAERLCWHLPNWRDLGLENFPKIVEIIIDNIKEQFKNPSIDNSGVAHYTIGYTDMIYLPCLYSMTPPFSIRSYLDYVLCDECQDLSVLQQLFLKLLNTTTTRFIFVGDENQAIYGFAGADTKSIKNLKKNFSLTELPLNICYRCPENVIKLSQTLVPSIDWNHSREDKGDIRFIKESELKDIIKPKDVILGRRNKDLVKIYKQLVLDAKVPVKFKNEDMVSSIITEIKRVIKEYIRRYNLQLNVERALYTACEEHNIQWKLEPKLLKNSDKKFIDNKYKQLVKDNKLSKRNISKSNHTIKYLEKCMIEYKDQGAYNYTPDGSEDGIYTDYFDVIESLINQYKEVSNGISVVDFLEYVEGFLKGNLNKELPVLSSIHMMKGGEADNVFILEYPRFPYIYNNQTEDSKQQEKNLQYVALTRPKKNLYLCLIKDCKPRETLEDIIKLNETCKIDVNAVLQK